jgi:protocatechuate 3,4-dioxygenase alpha subunit
MTAPLVATAWQTVGPFFHYGLAWPGGERIAREGTPGVPLRLEGRVQDGTGAPVPDALVEIWQADPEGRFRHPLDPAAAAIDRRFRGFGRVPTDGDGRFVVQTVWPGPVPGPGDTLQAPHLLVGLMMRGLLCRLVTRVYLAGEPLNDADPILARIPDAARRATLLARPADDGVSWRWTVRLQGRDETVFFEV